MVLRSGTVRPIPGGAMPPTGQGALNPQDEAPTSETSTPEASRSAENSISYNVPTSNSFSLLNNDNKSASQVSSKPVKPQPIVVPGASAANLRNLLVAQNTKFTMRISPAGIKLFPADVTTHTAILSILKAQNINYFSFSPRDITSKKFVLFGLDNYPEDEVQSLLEAEGLKPSAVKKMRINKQRYADESNYLIYFNQNEMISLSDLRDKKFINYTRVSWDHYKIKSPTVTQCHKCMAFGHGTSNCGMPEKCGVCAKNHITGNCPLILEKQRTNQRQINPNKLRCANCNEKHTATFRGCSQREQYIKSRGSSRRPQSQSQQVQRPLRTAQPLPPTNDIEFPAMPRPTTSLNGPAPHTHTIPNPWQRGATTIQPEVGDNSSFTGQDITIMLNEIFSSLQGCRSKAEQAKVILELGIKYFSKFP